MPAEKIPNSAFRLYWRRTWPVEADDDFVAREGIDYCRIRREQGGPQDGRWGWATAGGNRNLGTGFADTAREAAYAAEQAYIRWKEQDAAMRVVHERIQDTELVPWGEGTRSLAVRWASGKENAWPITGPIATHRERIYVTPDDGRRLLALLNKELTWRQAARYVEWPGRRHVMGLPGVIFDWVEEPEAD